MAVTADASKSLTEVEVKLLSDFATLVAARQITGNSKVNKLELLYDENVGYSVELVETPNTPSEAK